VTVDRETAQVSRDKTCGNIETVGIHRGAKIVDKLVRARLADRPAFLDFERAFFSRVLCLRTTPRREDYCPEGEHNGKNAIGLLMPTSIHFAFNAQDCFEVVEATLSLAQMISRVKRYASRKLASGGWIGS
jgi:hypothetical protein